MSPDRDVAALASLTPEQKLRFLKEMGFIEIFPGEHAAGCSSRQRSTFECGCHPPTTSWKAPSDVRRFMGETEEARREFALNRQAYSSTGTGEDPGPWMTHLEKTAERYSS